MSASTRKMPDPIMEPITIAVELNRPRLCTSRGASATSQDEVEVLGEMEFWVVT
jgi:hypothetical protein